MQRQFWNKESLNRDFVGCETLQNVIAAVSKQFNGKGQVICEVRANELLLTEEEERKFSGTPLAQLNSLEIQAATPQELLDGALESCREYFEQMTKVFERVADQFRSEDTHKAQQSFQKAIKGADWFVQLLTHYKVVHENLRGPVAMSWKAAEFKLLSILNQVLDASERKDFVLLADLLEYEVINCFNQWQELLQNGTEAGVVSKT